MIFTDICIVFFAAFMVIHGSGLMSKGMNQMSSAIGIKMGYIYSAIPIGGILLIIFGIEKIIERLRTQNQLGSEG
jgi:TRAP-type C4-dicarboxylate transport system permease small subunit